MLHFLLPSLYILMRMYGTGEVSPGGKVSAGVARKRSGILDRGGVYPVEWGIESPIV